MANQLIIVAGGIVLLFLLSSVGIVMLCFFPAWLRGVLSGTPITMINLLGMRLRRSNVNAIVDQCIAASQAGHPVSCADMERAWLQKVDIEKVTLAYITAKKRELNFTFQELVDAERAGRLEELLKR